MIQTLVLGPITIHLYGLILGVAVIAAWEWLLQVTRREKITVAWLDTTVWVVILFGLVGARLYHVIDYWWYYRIHPIEILFVWQGGLGIWGAVMGGIVGFFAAVRWGRIRQQEWMRGLDLVALALPLGQAIGRWGNWVNFELFGRPTTVPWGWEIPKAYRPVQYMSVSRFHPLFLYESVLDIGLFILLNRWRKRAHIGSGAFFGGYLIGYGVIRFGLEWLRINNWVAYGLPVAQWVSLIAMVGGVIIWCRIKR